MISITFTDFKNNRAFSYTGVDQLTYRNNYFIIHGTDPVTGHPYVFTVHKSEFDYINMEIDDHE